MPTHDLTTKAAPLERFCVIGQRLDSPETFIRHVALYNGDTDRVEYGQPVDVAHMGPPLAANEKIDAHAAGSVPLTSEEIAAIETWIEKIEDEYRAVKPRAFVQYIVRPPFEDYRDRNTGVRRHRRFSCAGFVLDAHLQVEIELVATDEAGLPEVGRDEIGAAYPELARMDDQRRAWLGIPGDGPWRVVLAGYVLHALNRPTDKIRSEPYRARPGDCRF
jgi:hypothetical protein